MALRLRAMDQASVENVPAHQVAAVIVIAHAQGRGITATVLAPTQEIASMSVTAARGTVAPRNVAANVTVIMSALTAGRGNMTEQGRETGRGTEKGETLGVIHKTCFVCSG